MNILLRNKFFRDGLFVVVLTILLFSFSSPVQAASRSYTVAVFGDSMVDTMGTNLPYLSKYLRAKYPNLKIEYYNYGIGSQNLSTAIGRFYSPYSYKDRNYPPICQLVPDALIVGSFAYNVESPYVRDNHWTNMLKLVDMSKKCSKKTYLFAEIAPLKTSFAVGPGGVNLTADDRVVRAREIKEMLENGVAISKGMKVILINLYAATMSADGFGNKVYINSNDGIHPSVAGQELAGKIMARAISF